LRKEELLRKQHDAEEQLNLRKTRQYASLEQKTRFEEFCRQNELAITVENQLFEVLSKTDVALLCDDSGSMRTTIKEPNKPPITRWQELKRLAATCIEIVTAINPAGLDLYFLNRPPVKAVTSVQGLQAVFDTPPAGVCV
jgi:hypothetical protein